MEVARPRLHGDPDSKGNHLNHLIRAQQHRLRDREAEFLGGIEMDDKVELCRLLNGEIGGFRTLEDLVDVDMRALLVLRL